MNRRSDTLLIHAVCGGTLSDMKRTNISLTPDTLERLDQYAFENHMNRSQAITQLVWNAKVKKEQLRGQMNVNEFLSADSKSRNSHR